MPPALGPFFNEMTKPNATPPGRAHSPASRKGLERDILAFGNERKATHHARFFKTGAGEYGEGDVFIGITMPELRRVVSRYADLPSAEIERLLQAREHEFRMAALILLVAQFRRGDEAARKNIYALYIRHAHRVNNWDLVDASAEHIVGPWLEGRREKTAVLTRLARSPLIWKRRIAMLATFYSIKAGRPDDALAIAELLLGDAHDLMHKAVGWMLREVGKRCSVAALEGFLARHYRIMPRTMLRYAIERFPKSRRQAYLKGTV